MIRQGAIPCFCFMERSLYEFIYVGKNWNIGLTNIKQENKLENQAFILKRRCQAGGRRKDINNSVLFSESCGLLEMTIRESRKVLIQWAIRLYEGLLGIEKFTFVRDDLYIRIHVQRCLMAVSYKNIPYADRKRHDCCSAAASGRFFSQYYHPDETERLFIAGKDWKYLPCDGLWRGRYSGIFAGLRLSALMIRHRKR